MNDPHPQPAAAPPGGRPRPLRAARHPQPTPQPSAPAAPAPPAARVSPQVPVWRHFARKSNANGPSVDEAYRIIRTNLDAALDGIGRPVVVVTSAAEGEGKTSAVTRLARAVAWTGRTVAVADLDLRHPTVHTVLGVPNTAGVAEILRGDTDLDACLHTLAGGGDPTATGPILALTAGRAVTSPAELLAGVAAGRLLDTLAAKADLVLVDSPPVLPVADTLQIAPLASGVLLVVEARRTPVPAVLAAKHALARHRARILGMIINKTRRGDATSLTAGYASLPAGPVSTR